MESHRKVAGPNICIEREGNPCMGEVSNPNFPATFSHCDKAHVLKCNKRSIADCKTLNVQHKLWVK